MSIIGLGHKSQVGKDLVTRIIQYLTSNADEDYTFEEYEKIYHLLGNHSIGYYPDWENKKFATKLKQIVCLLTGCTLSQLEDNEFKESKLPSLWNREILTCGCDGLELGFPVEGKCYNCGEDTKSDSMTYRELLQRLGTNLLRRQLHSEVWVNALMSDYVCTLCDRAPNGEDCPNWVISDVRFPNEFKAIKDRGGIMIRIDRDMLSERCTECIKDDKCPSDQKLCTTCMFYDGKYLPLSKHESETALDNEKGWDYIIKNNGTIESLIKQVKEILIKEKIL